MTMKMNDLNGFKFFSFIPLVFAHSDGMIESEHIINAQYKIIKSLAGIDKSG